jgi:ribosomal protein L3 glutamine methyltransferase
MVATPTESDNEVEPAVDQAAQQTMLLLPVPATVAATLDCVFAALEAAELFYGHGTDNAWDEAVLLVLSACELPPDAGEEVLELPLRDDARAAVQRWTNARIHDRLPLPYLLGRAWFAGYEFLCDARALVPRSPLAELIRADYAPWWTGPPPRRLLDLCCGGGCIGLAAALYNPELQVVLSDIDDAALSLAEENIDYHGLNARVRTQQSDLFAALNGERFDIILSNPPYVDEADLAQMPGEYTAEPARGLGSGPDGLELARQILCQARAQLAPGGLLFLELGNSWVALDELLSRLPLTWLEFHDGGHGVLALRDDELAAVEAALAGQNSG